MFLEICNGNFKPFNVVSKQPNASVAIATKQPANLASGMIVVNREDTTKICYRANNIITATNSTFAILGIKNCLILFVGHAKLFLEAIAKTIKFFFVPILLDVIIVIFLYTYLEMALVSVRFRSILEKLINWFCGFTLTAPFISIRGFWASLSDMSMSTNIFVWLSRNCAIRPIVSSSNFCFSATSTVAISIRNLFL